MQRKFYTISLLDPKLKWERFGVKYSSIIPYKYNPLETMEHEYERAYLKRIQKVKANHNLLLLFVISGASMGIFASLFIFQNLLLSFDFFIYTLLGTAAGLIIYFYELEKIYCYETAIKDRTIKGFKSGFAIIKEKDWPEFLNNLHALQNPKKAA